MIEYALRPATAADVGTLVDQQRSMFSEMGRLTDATAASFEVVAREKIERSLQENTLFGWLIECDGRAVAGGAVFLVESALPTPANLACRPMGIILGMWTEPDHRQRGLATRIVREILAWCRSRGVWRVSLSATEAGRGVYEALGFRPNATQMDIYLNDAQA